MEIAVRKGNPRKSKEKLAWEAKYKMQDGCGADQGGGEVEKL